jgi:hypothetical protein
MSAPDDRLINPFTVVHYHGRPMRPLSPFEFPEHRDYYVDIDHSLGEFEKFQRQFADLPMPLEAAQPVLVTGDTGCGKSALLRRCADWLRDRLAAKDCGLKCEIIDLTWKLEATKQLVIARRAAEVCDELCTELEQRGLVEEGRLEELQRIRHQPDRVYGLLRTGLRAQRAVIILLPSVRDLPDEVVKYVMYPLDRVFFFMESAFLTEDDLELIVRRCERVITPILLHVDPLRPDDAVLFVRDRLRRHDGRGIFPRMSEADMHTLGQIRSLSVAQLQRDLHTAYQKRLEDRLRYDNDQMVTLAELGQTFDWHEIDPGTAS